MEDRKIRVAITHGDTNGTQGGYRPSKGNGDRDAVQRDQ